MNSARICDKCNWVNPVSYTNSKCRLCSTILSTQLCAYCNKWLPTDLFTFRGNVRWAGCVTCKTERSLQYSRDNPEKYTQSKQRRRDKAEKMYKEWLTKVDKPFVPMTEAAWLETCSYFGGCAICGKEHIESRQFFVKFENGGRYTAWNMFPMCAGCATRTRFTENPFIWVISQPLQISSERRDKLIEYLVSQIERLL